MDVVPIHVAGIFFHFDWRQRRRFVLVSMRDFGLGKRSLEERMVEEAGFLMDELEKSGGEPADLSTILPCATANIICRIIVGRRCVFVCLLFYAIATVVQLFHMAVICCMR